MCRLRTGVRLSECILENHNLYKDLCVVIKTKKWRRSSGYKIKDFLKS